MKSHILLYATFIRWGAGVHGGNHSWGVPCRNGGALDVKKDERTETETPKSEERLGLVCVLC